MTFARSWPCLLNEIAERFAAAIREASVGFDHPDAAADRAALAAILDATGYERALRLLESRGLDRHPQVATLKANIARLDA